MVRYSGFLKNPLFLNVCFDIIFRFLDFFKLQFSFLLFDRFVNVIHHIVETCLGTVVNFVEKWKMPIKFSAAFHDSPKQMSIVIKGSTRVMLNFFEIIVVFLKRIFEISSTLLNC